MPDKTSVLPNGSISEILKEINKFSDAEFGNFLTKTTTEKSFLIGDDGVDDLSGDIEIGKPLLGMMLAALAFLYERLEDSRTSTESFSQAVLMIVDDLKIFQDEKDHNNKQKLSDRLKQLLDFNKDHERYIHIERLKHGLVPSALNFDTFIDIRPAMNEKRTELYDLLNVIQLRIQVNAENPAGKEFTFEMSESSLKELQECLRDAEKKINFLKQQNFLQNNLLG